MNRRTWDSRDFAAGLSRCIGIAFLLIAVIALSLKRELTEDFIGVRFLVRSHIPVQTQLYYSYDDSFHSELYVNDGSNSNDTIQFLIPYTGKTVKKFRLDLGNDRGLQKVEILEMHLMFKNRIVSVPASKLKRTLFQNSGSVILGEQGILTINQASEPFDPYIVFMALGVLAMPTGKLLLALLSPFAIFLIIYLIKSKALRSLSWQGIAISLFLFSIPLKIAWTTFTAIILGLNGLTVLSLKREFRPDRINSYFLIALFLVLLITGRPTEFGKIEKEFALVLFAFVGATIAFPKEYIFNRYSMIMLTFFAMMGSAGLAFLFWFPDFFGAPLGGYFSGIKEYSGIVRNWVPYDHAAFLSFFGLIGVLFVHYLHKRQKLSAGFTFLYHCLLLLFIILSGARIGMLIYLLISLNILLGWNWRRLLILNIVFLLVYSFLLVGFIDRIDTNRAQLWNISWHAIKEKPIFGYGLDQSKEVLQHSAIAVEQGYEINPELNHSHNQLLTILMEVGIFGLATMVLISVLLFIKMRYYKDKMLMTFLFGLLLMCTSESILQTSKPLYVICFLFLLFAQASHTLNPPRKQ